MDTKVAKLKIDTDTIIIDRESTIYMLVEVFNGKRYVFQGVARLKEGDKYDIERAKKIAKLKAVRKMVKFEMNMHKENYEKTMNEITSTYRSIDKSIRKLCRRAGR